MSCAMSDEARQFFIIWKIFFFYIDLNKNMSTLLYGAIVFK